MAVNLCNHVKRFIGRLSFGIKDGKESSWSKVANFELGLLDNHDWMGKWIKAF